MGISKQKHLKEIEEEAYIEEAAEEMFLDNIADKEPEEDFCKYDVNKNTYGGGKEGRIKIPKDKKYHEAKYEPPLPVSVVKEEGQIKNYIAKRVIYTDENGNKIKEVRGIRSACKVMKTRFAKPFEGVQLKIPYETGMDPYSGLLDLFEKKNLITQSGNRLKYITADGKEILDYRKNWGKDNLEIVMSEVSNQVIKEQEADTTAVEEQNGDSDAD